MRLLTRCSFAATVLAQISKRPIRPDSIASLLKAVTI